MTPTKILTPPTPAYVLNVRSLIETLFYNRGRFSSIASCKPGRFNRCWNLCINVIIMGDTAINIEECIRKYRDGYFNY